MRSATSQRQGGHKQEGCEDVWQSLKMKTPLATRWSVPEAAPLNQEGQGTLHSWQLSGAEHWENTISILTQKNLMPHDCIQEQKGCLRGSAICWPAVKGTGDRKRCFPSCSREQPICYPALAQCRGNPSRTRSLLPEFPGNTPQTILPTRGNARFFPACLFVFFLFIAPDS